MYQITTTAAATQTIIITLHLVKLTNQDEQ